MKTNEPITPAVRRQAAEARWSATLDAHPSAPEADLRRMQQELQIHQIELEMQNEELRAAQAEVQAGLERYTDLFDFAPVGYFNFAVDGEVKLVNLTGAALLGIERARLVGRRLGLFLAESDRPALAEFLSQIFSSGNRQSCEVALRPEGKKPVFLRFDGRLTPGGGECRAVLSDVTERREMEEQLRHAQRVAAIGTLSAGIAHDINNTLTPILMVTGLLKEKVADPHDRELIEIVRESAVRGGNVVQMLLAFSRGLEGERVVMEVSRLVKDMMAIMRETFPRELTLKYDLAGDLRPVCANPTQIHQVLMNLCLNARDAMPNGGTLSLDARIVMLSEEDVKGHPPVQTGLYVALRVGDTGTGIASDDLQRVFDLFYTTKVREKGTGLGLSVSFGIVRSHGGFITVKSELGRGSTFSVFLPTVMEKSAVSANLVETAPAGRGELILLVDDEPMVSDTMKLVLEFAGYQVIIARDGAEGLELYRQRQDEVKLVLTDLMMPLMDGAALIHQLRALNPKLGIILVSGLLESEKRTQIEADGVDCILPKPCDGQRLLRTIAQQLARLENAQR